MLTRTSYCCVSALLAVLLAGCGATPAAKVDVEGTVQARVSATVGQIVRAQSTTARPPAGTAASTAPAPTSASRTAVVTALPLGSPSGAAVTSAAGTVTPGGTASPAGAAPLTFGSFARVGGVSVSATHWEWGSSCPSGSGRPAAGVKFVTLQIAERNDGTAATGPAMAQWTVNGNPASAGGQSPCAPDDQALVNTCYRTSQLAAGARCEGWLVFEVPEAMDVNGAIVQARAAPDTAQWRIPA